VGYLDDDARVRTAVEPTGASFILVEIDRVAEAAPARKESAAARAEADNGSTKVDRALAPYAGDIGKVPDAEIAEKAGISRSAVSAYRQRHGIKASGRGGRPPGSGRAAARPPVVAAPAAAARAAAPASAPAPSAPAPSAPSAPAAVAAAAPRAASATRGDGKSFVYRVVASRPGDKRVFGVIAANAVEAAREAFERLTGRDDAWVIQSIRLLGDALPG
ncbi:MAG: hypothetical protein ACK4YP_27315, partial [Myxococcota bacterium]